MQPRACEGDESFEVGFELFVSRGEAAEVFEAREAAFDAVALPIEIFIVAALQLPVGFGRHDGHRSHGLDVVENRLTIVALVGQHPSGLAVSQQSHRLGAVIDLPCGDEEVDGQAQFIGQQVDLRRQASSGTPQSLVFAPFLRPVAACWCARTMVESIIRYRFFRSRTSS